LKTLIVGASRGIGLEFVRQYRADAGHVVGTARSDTGLAAIEALGASALRLDVTEAASAGALASGLNGELFDLVVINAGVYGPRTSALESPSADDFNAVMHTNVLGPMRVLPQLVDALAPGAKLAVISSRMGSIGSRESTGGWLYRASKAAVNSVLKDASIALKGKAICIAFHPGWVRTDMGGAGADLSPEQSVAGMRQVLAGLQAGDSGRFFNYDGTPIVW
jgi:NAD(P)-dependent dehydrogenase (short-subunit alcohol dehydrogenase family)